MSNARHAAHRRHIAKPSAPPPAVVAPVEEAPVAPVRGRHRATPARQLGRGSVVAGAAALSLAAAAGLASASTGVPLLDPADNAPTVDHGTTAPAALAAPEAAAASRSAQRPALSVPAAVAATDQAAAAQSARALARNILAERTAAIEQAAAAAAQAKLTALHRACDYTPAVQRHPDHNATQLRNVRTIVEVAQRMNLPPRAAVIAVATAQQESELINMSGGDRDSVGLFQQRPSMGWGSYSQVHDPEYAAKQFYNSLTAIHGWQHLPLTVAAQRVEVSAFGWAYARWEGSAAQLVSAALDVPADQLNCTPR